MDLPKPVTSGTYFLWRFLIAAFVLVSAASIFPAQRTSSSEPGDGTASPLFQQTLPNVDGKMFSSLIVDLPPGGRAAPHRYGQSFVYAYVLDGAARTRLVCKAIRRRFPDASLIVGAWGSEQIRVTNDKPEAVEGATAVYRKASDVLRELRALVPFMAVKTEEASAAKAPPAVAESLLGRAVSPTLCSI